ncbi:MAG: hypothetical protein ACK4L7_11545, partial [Flavobacteriales bacterium]
MGGRIALLACAHALAAISAAQRTFTHNDTTFLLRDFREGYRAVFIAAAFDTVWLQRLAAPPGDMQRHPYVRKQQRMLAELGIRPMAVAPGPADGLADYIGVVLHEGRFFLYAPSEWVNHRQQQVGLQWLITKEADGPLAHAIVGRVAPVNGELLHLRCVSMLSHA